MLRVIHALVFLTFAALAVTASFSELQQIAFAARGPYHSGTPPFWPAVLGAAVSVGGALALLARVARRREVSLFISLSILIGFAVALTVNGSNPEGRSIAAANVALLEGARVLQRTMGQRLQQTGEVPTDSKLWSQTLEDAAREKPELSSPLRDRLFQPLPTRVELVSAEDWVGQGSPPGTLGVWISPDRAWFTVTPFGLSPGGSAEVLKDDAQRPIRLRGVYNPDMAPGGGH